MKRRHDLTIERAREVFVYDRTKGDLLWRITIGRRAIAGNVAGSNNNAYRRVHVDGVSYYVHCIIWLLEHGVWPDGELDHADTAGSNNKIENLRPATLSQNRANVGIRADNTSGYKGVSRCGNRWKAQICVNKTVIYLGLFRTSELAARKYEAEARRHFNEFARTA